MTHARKTMRRIVRQAVTYIPFLFRVESTQTVGTQLAFQKPQQGKTTAVSNVTVRFIDVGQNDCILITYQNWTCIVDSGNRFSSQGEKIDTTLTALNMTSIDLAVATHAGADHIGQFTHVMNTVTIEEFWVNGLPHTSQTWVTMNQTMYEKGIPVTAARRGDIYTIGNVTMGVVSPVEPLSGDQNTDSIVFTETLRRRPVISSIW